jgi:hypothetical protein
LYFLLSIDSLLYGIEVKRNVYIDLLFLFKAQKNRFIIKKQRALLQQFTNTYMADKRIGAEQSGL